MSVGTIAADSVKPKLASGVQRLVAVAMKPSSVCVFDQAIVSAANFGTGVLLGNACSKESLGLYYLSLTLVLFSIGILSELTSAPYHIYFNRRAGRALRRYTGSVIFTHVAATFMVLSLLAGVLAALGRLESLSSLLHVLAWAAPLMIGREFVRQMSFARRRFGTALAIDLFASTVQIGLLAWLFSTGRLTAATALASLGVAGGIVVTGWLLFTGFSKEMTVSPSRWRIHFLRNWHVGRWGVATSLVGSSTPFVMPWVLEFFHGEGATGLLGACNQLIGLSYMFVNGVANSLTAEAARAFREGGKPALMTALKKTTLMLSAVLLPFILAAGLFGGWGLEFIYGPDFAGQGLVCLVIATGVFATGMSVVAGNGLWAIERPKAGFLADVGVLVVTAVLAFTLVPTFGVLGAAVTTAGGIATGAAARWAGLMSALAKREA